MYDVKTRFCTVQKRTTRIEPEGESCAHKVTFTLDSFDLKGYK